MHTQKNLLYLHLEATSQMLFWNHLALQPNLYGLKEKSMYFSRCFAPGPSTIFTHRALFYGSTCGVDHHPRYPGAVGKLPGVDGTAFHEHLQRRHGYETYHISAAIKAPMGPMFTRGFEHILACRPEAVFDSVASVLHARRSSSSPFFMFVACITDLAHGFLTDAAAFDSVERDMSCLITSWLKIQDAIAGAALDALRKLGLMDNTMIVAYGDHGVGVMEDVVDGNGSTGPRTEKSWVPLMIYNSPYGKGISDQLVGMEDLPVTVSRMLHPESPPYMSSLPCSGVDITREKRPFVVSQNKFALQDSSWRFYELPKQYAITDGAYRLMVTDVEGGKSRGGLSLFLETCDYENKNDLLQWFELNAKGNITGFSYNAIHGITGVGQDPLGANPISLRALVRRYEELRQNLRKWVEDKEAFALRRFAVEYPGEEPYRFSPASFNVAQCGWDRKKQPVPFVFEEGARKYQELAANNRPVLLFGYHLLTQQVRMFLRYYGIEIAGVIENDPLHHGRNYEGLVILSPEEEAELFPGALVISCLRNPQSIAETMEHCRKLGFEYRIYVADILGMEWRHLLGYDGEIIACYP